jgi:adenosylmethionine-8-amino-7-oxononanoate aminotransferase
LEHVIYAGFAHEPGARLAASLCQHLGPGLNRVFYSDDGSTAVEVALKLVAQHWQVRGQERGPLLCFREGYHGDTLGAMSASGESVFHRPFRKLLFPVTVVDVPLQPDASDTIAQIQQLTAGQPKPMALILEPLLLGAGGMVTYPASALKALAEYAHQHDIPLIADEVLTGFGRTGTLWAHQQAGIVPDVVCLSKGITGGFLPLGATVVHDRLFASFDSADLGRAFLHGHSYTGNPLACAAGLASLNLLLQPETQANWQRIQALHATFRDSLIQQQLGLQPRVLGTLFAVNVPVPDAGYLSSIRTELYQFGLQHGVLLRPLGNVLYLLPPYCVTNGELALCYRTIEAALRKFSSRNFVPQPLAEKHLA